MRVRFGFQLAADARQAARQPRYSPPPASPWPPPPAPGPPAILVVSLPAAAERRAAVEAQLDEQHIPFRWWDAVDGSAPLPEDEVRWYVAGRRWRDYRSSAPGSLAHRKAACDLSHLRLMHDMLAAGRDTQVVLEDDAQLLDADFLGRLNATMAALPADWEVLWLNHGRPIQRRPSHLAGWVGPGVRLFTDNSGTIGMVYRRSFALKVSKGEREEEGDTDKGLLCVRPCRWRPCAPPANTYALVLTFSHSHFHPHCFTTGFERCSDREQDD